MYSTKYICRLSLNALQCCTFPVFEEHSHAMSSSSHGCVHLVFILGAAETSTVSEQTASAQFDHTEGLPRLGKSVNLVSPSQDIHPLAYIIPSLVFLIVILMLTIFLVSTRMRLRKTDKDAKESNQRTQAFGNSLYGNSSDFHRQFSLDMPTVASALQDNLAFNPYEFAKADEYHKIGKSFRVLRHWNDGLL